MTIWGNEQEKKNFDELKNYSSILPILSAPVKDEQLFLYLAISKEAVSAILFKEEQEKKKLVFYVSRMLLDAETKYSMM